MRCPSRVLIVGLCLSLVTFQANGQVRYVRGDITDAQLEAIIRWLDLTHDQTVVVRELHQNYSQRLKNELLQPIWAYHDRADAVLREMFAEGANTGVVQRTLSPSLWREYDRLIGQMRDLDENFFKGIEAVLIGDQLGRMSRVRNGLFRMRAASSQRNQICGGNVDLVELCEGLSLDPDVHRIVDDFLGPFEATYAKLIQSSFDAAFEQEKLQADYYDLQHQLRHNRPNMTIDEQRAAQKRLDEVLERAGRVCIPASEALVRHNQHGLTELLRILPPEAGAELQRRFSEQAYPNVYPDDGSAARLFDAALSLDDLEAPQRESLEALREAWAFRHELLSEGMEEALYQVYWTTHAGRPCPFGGSPQCWEVLARRGHEREEHNEHQIEVIRPLLSAEQFARLPAWDFTTDPPRRRFDQ